MVCFDVNGNTWKYTINYKNLNENKYLVIFDCTWILKYNFYSYVIILRNKKYSVITNKNNFYWFKFIKWYKF